MASALVLCGIRHTEALIVQNVRAVPDHRKGGFFGFGRIKAAADEADLESYVGLHLTRVRHKGMHQTVRLRDRETADYADMTTFRHESGNNTEVSGGILNVVIKYGQVRRGRVFFKARPHQKGDFPVFCGQFARFLFGADDLADDQCISGFSIFA